MAKENEEVLNIYHYVPSMEALQNRVNVIDIHSLNVDWIKKTVNEKSNDYNYYNLSFCENYYKPSRKYIPFRDIVFNFEKNTATLPITVSKEYASNVGIIGRTIKEGCYGSGGRGEKIEDCPYKN
jgi:hypothetical protein